MTGRRRSHVLFDASGTLIETREPVGATYARVAAAHGVRVPARRVEDAFGHTLQHAPPRLFPDAAPGEVVSRERDWWREVVRGTLRTAGAPACFPAFDACFDQLFAHFAGAGAWRVRPGATEALGELAAAGHILAVVSNFDRRLPGILEGLGLAPHFAAIVLPSEAGAAKPDPRIFRRALEILGARAETSVFVGDDAARDLEGARAAGLRAIDATSLATLAELPGRIARTLEEPRA